MEKKDRSIVELIGLLVIGLAVAVPIAFYYAWIVSKMIDWFKLPVHLSILQIWAVFQILALYKTRPETKGKEYSAIIGGLIGDAVGVSFVLLVTYLIHLLWT